MNIKLAYLRTLCMVIERGSFSRAAQDLGITQPAVSQQIRRLEADYGTQLIHRQGGDVVPTPAGRAAYEYATQIVSMYERSKGAARDSASQIAGTLEVAASTGVGEDFLPGVLVSFQEEFSEVRVNLQVGDSSEILERLLKERIDLGFVGRTQQDRHLQFEHFMEDRLILVVSPRHSVAAAGEISRKEFLELPLVLQQSGSGATSALHQSLSEHGVHLKDLSVIAEVGLQESTKAMVRSGVAGTLISRLGALRDLAEGRLVEVEIEGLDLRHDFYVAFSRDWPLPPAATAFIDMARRALRAIDHPSL